MTNKANGTKPGTVTANEKATGQTVASSNIPTHSNFKPEPLEFAKAGMILLWVTHNRDCPGTVGKVSQCKCNPRVESVTSAEFVHRIRLEAKHGL